MMGVIEVFDDALFCIIHDSTIEKISFFLWILEKYILSYLAVYWEIDFQFSQVSKV
jgi:hypothetical protein